MNEPFHQTGRESNEGRRTKRKDANRSLGSYPTQEMGFRLFSVQPSEWSPSGKESGVEAKSTVMCSGRSSIRLAL